MGGAEVCKERRLSQAGHQIIADVSAVFLLKFLHHLHQMVVALFVFDEETPILSQRLVTHL
jgi:hypothetical protein